MTDRLTLQKSKFERLFSKFRTAAATLTRSHKVIERLHVAHRSLTDKKRSLTDEQKSRYITNQQAVQKAHATIERIWPQLKPLVHRFHTAKTSHLFATLDRVPDQILPRYINEKIAIIERVLRTYAEETEHPDSRAQPVVVSKSKCQTPERSTETADPREADSRGGEKKKGRWVSPKEFAELTGTNEQTLANQRSKDRKAGCPDGRPEYPKHKKFGTAVRYWLEAERE